MEFSYITPISVGFFTAFIMGPVFWVLLETSITKGVRAAIAFDAVSYTHLTLPTIYSV